MRALCFDFIADRSIRPISELRALSCLVLFKGRRWASLKGPKAVKHFIGPNYATDKVPRIDLTGILRPISLSEDDTHLYLVAHIQHVEPESRYLLQLTFVRAHVHSNISSTSAELRLYGHAFLEPLSKKTIR